MDPNAVLARIRERVAEIQQTGEPYSAADIGFELADDIEALDEWLGRGGFLPTDWNKTRPTG